jgi:hypothetical protein
MNTVMNLPSSVICEEFLTLLGACQLLKKSSALWGSKVIFKYIRIHWEGGGGKLDIVPTPAEFLENSKLKRKYTKSKKVKK